MAVQILTVHIFQQLLMYQQNFFLLIALFVQMKASSFSQQKVLINIYGAMAQSVKVFLFSSREFIH
jgi:hypothetical protein